MATSFDTVRVAAVQATPVILDAEACITKAVRLIGEAAGQGARLVVLPETFVPLYPSNRWAAGAARFGGWDEMWERLWENSVDVPGRLVARLVAACGEHDVICVIGVNERESQRPGSLYNTMLTLGPAGVLAKHRKIMPTHQERLFHGFGRGDDLAVVDTAAGRVGGLICWENRMPLARYAVYQQGPQIGAPRPRMTPTAGRPRCATSPSSPGPSSSACRNTSRRARSRTTSRCRCPRETARSAAAAR